MNTPEVVIVLEPVFVNRPERLGATANETDVTEPEPAEGFTQVSDVPFEANN